MFTPIRMLGCQLAVVLILLATVVVLAQEKMRKEIHSSVQQWFWLSWLLATFVYLLLITIGGFPFYDSPTLIVYGLQAFTNGLGLWVVLRLFPPNWLRMLAVSAVISAIYYMGAVLVVVGVDHEWPMHICMGGIGMGSFIGLVYGGLFLLAGLVVGRVRARGQTQTE